MKDKKLVTVGFIFASLSILITLWLLYLDKYWIAGYFWLVLNLYTITRLIQYVWED